MGRKMSQSRKDAALTCPENKIPYKRHGTFYSESGVTFCRRRPTRKPTTGKTKEPIEKKMYYIRRQISPRLGGTKGLVGQNFSNAGNAKYLQAPPGTFKLKGYRRAGKHGFVPLIEGVPISMPSPISKSLPPSQAEAFVQRLFA